MPPHLPRTFSQVLPPPPVSMNITPPRLKQVDHRDATSHDRERRHSLRLSEGPRQSTFLIQKANTISIPYALFRRIKIHPVQIYEMRDPIELPPAAVGETLAGIMQESY